MKDFKLVLTSDHLYKIGAVLVVIFLYFLFFNSKDQSATKESQLSSNPIPTIDLDPLVPCSWEKLSNGVECPPANIRRSECKSRICCYLGNGTATPLSKLECAEFQAKLNANIPAPPRVEMPQTTRCYKTGFGQFASVTCKTF